MPKLVALGIEIALALGDNRGDDRHLVDYGQVIAIVNKCIGFLGVIRQQPYLREAEILEDLQADAVIAQIGSVAECEVGLHGIEPLVLEVVGADLFDQADASPLLGKIDEGAYPLLAYH